MTYEELIRLYFAMGLSYQDIKLTLSKSHGYHISVRHLKRKLHVLKLTRRKGYCDLGTLYDFMRNQLKTSGQLHGYRWMYQKCIANGLLVKKEHVRQLLKILDADGVELRQRRSLKRRLYWSKGPNFCWHLDGYDKLKPYGLCINGCIDGHSRKIIWLRAGQSNSDSRLVAKYFIDAVEEYGGCPLSMRGDLGTENVRVAAMERFLRRSEGDRNDKTFIYGKSTLNTRIESWWGVLRKECCQLWIDELRSLRDAGEFTGSQVDINLIQFCFLRLLQDELDEIVTVWNMHRIRANKNSNCPSGRPNILHLLPHLEECQDHLCPVSEEEINVCRMECAPESIYPCEEEIFELGYIYMAENNINPPRHFIAAKNLYIEFRGWLLRQLHV